MFDQRMSYLIRLEYLRENSNSSFGMGKFLRQIMGLAKRRARRYLGVAKVLMQSSAHQRYPHSTTKRTIRPSLYSLTIGLLLFLQNLILIL